MEGTDVDAYLVSGIRNGCVNVDCAVEVAVGGGFNRELCCVSGNYNNRVRIERGVWPFRDFDP
jgi:hypothetical protein